MRFLFAIAVVVLSVGATAEAGPIRDWVNDHRPGVVIPKRTYIPCIGDYVPVPLLSAPGCQCPQCPGCPAVGEFRIQPVSPARDITPAPVVLPNCPGGVCPKR